MTTSAFRSTGMTLCLVGLFGVFVPYTEAAPPRMTYQGQLKSNGRPVTATADFRARLWDAPTGGTIVAGFEPIAGVQVVNGLFTIELLLDTEPAAVFGGGTRYLELLVAVPAGTDSIPLTPRQPITAAPFALYALDAPGGGGGVLTLPFTGTNTTNSTGIAVTNRGLAPAAAFVTDNASNTQAAVLASTAGSGAGLLAMTAGTGPAVWALTGEGGGMAGLFKVQGVLATQDALRAENSAMGSAGHFLTSKRENTSPALVAETFSDGPAVTFTTHSDPNNANIASTVASENNSFGMAGRFAIQNSTSTSDALYAGTNGGGNATHAYTNGSGRAGFFEVENFGNRTVPALEVLSNGRGAGAGLFRTTNQLNTAPALAAESSGSAGAILGTARGLGAAVKGYNAFGGSGVVGLVEGSTGKAGSFTITQAVNPDAALEAITSGSGPAARFTHMNPGGHAADFVGDVSVIGTADFVGDVSAAGTVEADAYTYKQPREHYLSLTPADFTPNDGGQAWTRNWGLAGGGALAGNSRLGNTNFLCAPVHLPQGAIVTNVLAHYYHADPLFALAQLKVELKRRRLWNASDTPMATLIAPRPQANDNYSMETSVIFNPSIDNRDFGYWVYAGPESPCPDANLDCVHHPIYGVVITYTITGVD